MIQAVWLKGSDDLRQAIDIRMQVFVNEQGVPEELEVDEIDAVAEHVLVYDGDIPVATGRLFLENDRYMLGRVAVLKEFRGQGIGDLVMRMLLLRAFDLGAEEVYIHAQTQALNFYKKLGFSVYGEPFEEAGIPHVYMMVRKEDVLWYTPRGAAGVHHCKACSHEECNHCK